jgi:hypothetical protein
MLKIRTDTFDYTSSSKATFDAPSDKQPTEHRETDLTLLMASFSASHKKRCEVEVVNYYKARHHRYRDSHQRSDGKRGKTILLRATFKRINEQTENYVLIHPE